MHIITLILYVVAAACFAAAALKKGRRVNLLAAGLLAWVLVPLLGQIL